MASRMRSFLPWSERVQLRWYCSSPLETYKDYIRSGQLEPGNSAQERAVDVLEKLHQELRQAEDARWWQPMASRYQPPATTKGMYMYGTVGTGKTFLMDLFYNQVPVRSKRRVHFHSFMLDVHKRLHKHVGVSNALQVVALQLFEQSRLLCLDEVEVTDIADALILRRLFEVLWPMGIVVVATSNTVPDQLYQDGLNRYLFLPFIRQLKEYCNVNSLNSADGNDYRRRHAWSENLYKCPIDDTVDGIMDQIFLKLTGVEGTFQPVLGPMGRQFQILAAKDVARASFSYLCKSAFGAADYIAITENFSVLLLDRIPCLADPGCENEARRFINLIDILYEANTVLICSAAVPPDSLFSDNSQTEKLVKESTVVSPLEHQGIRIIGEGGSSGRSTLMIGNMEWSATGRQGASLAGLTGASFTRKAAPRAVSRLLEMQSGSYISRSKSAEIKLQLKDLGFTNFNSTL